MASTGTIKQCGTRVGHIIADDGSELKFWMSGCWGYPKLGARVSFEKTGDGQSAVNVRVQPQ